MIEAAIECHSAIDVFVKNHSDLDDDYLERSDWEKLEQTRGFLKPFYQATMHAQGDSANLSLLDLQKKRSRGISGSNLYEGCQTKFGAKTHPCNV